MNPRVPNRRSFYLQREPLKSKVKKKIKEQSFLSRQEETQILPQKEEVAVAAEEIFVMELGYDE